MPQISLHPSYLLRSLYVRQKKERIDPIRPMLDTRKGMCVLVYICIIMIMNATIRLWVNLMRLICGQFPTARMDFAGASAYVSVASKRGLIYSVRDREQGWKYTWSFFRSQLVSKVCQADFCEYKARMYVTLIFGVQNSTRVFNNFGNYTACFLECF